MNALRRKLDKYKAREWMSLGDEVLMEEIKVYKVREVIVHSTLGGSGWLTQWAGREGSGGVGCRDERLDFSRGGLPESVPLP